MKQRTPEAQKRLQTLYERVKRIDARIKAIKNRRHVIKVKTRWRTLEGAPIFENRAVGRRIVDVGRKRPIRAGVVQEATLERLETASHELWRQINEIR